MSNNEYQKRTISGYCTFVSRFLYSSFSSISNDLKSQIDEFLKNEIDIHPKTFKNCRAALYSFYKMNTGKQFSVKPILDVIGELEDLLTGFQIHTQEIKQLAMPSIKTEVKHVKRFLISTYEKCNGKLNISNITANDIRTFFVDEIPHLAPSTKGRMATSIRNFFHHQQFVGVSVHKSVFSLPLSPAVWKLAAVPTVLSDNHFNALPVCFNLNSPTGRRDYAIMLCFTDIGLRCNEVANICIDDFNWNEGIISIKNTKTHVDRKLPISDKFGSAVTEYIMNSRPQTSNRILFVKFSRTLGQAMGREQIRGVIRRAYARVGVNKKITGTHILRRTFASRIYKNGNSLKMVADILGHNSLDSTAIYTKVDMDRLFDTAGIWPGGVSDDE